MNKMIKKAALIALICLTASAACASLIDSNVVKGKGTVSAGFSLLQGFGLVTTGDFPIDNRMSVGGSFGIAFSSGNPNLMDLHMNLQFLEPTAKNALSASLIGGIWGGTSSGIWLSSHSRDFYIQPELGVGLSYIFNSRLTGRLNLVYGPTLGIELGYKFNPSIEGIFAISEQIVGIKFKVF